MTETGLMKLRSMNRASDNMWQVLGAEQDYSLALACAGLQVDHMQIRPKDNRMSFEFNLQKAFGLDFYCDNLFSELKQEDPRLTNYSNYYWIEQGYRKIQSTARPDGLIKVLLEDWIKLENEDFVLEK
jgi:hypothetical protein